MASPLQDYWNRTLANGFVGHVVQLTWTDGVVKEGKLERSPGGSYYLDGALLQRPPGATLQGAVVLDG